MIKIFIDQRRQRTMDYVEDFYSAFEIVSMDRDVFEVVIKSLNDKHDIHTCYPEFVNHIGRFHREFGPMWAGDEITLFAKREIDDDYQRFSFNKKGQIEHWHYGFFGD